MRKIIIIFSVILSIFLTSNAYASEIVKIQEGNFLDNGFSQYLVVDTDYENRSHAEGFQKAFIVDKENNNVIDLDQGGNLDFIVIDIDGDNKNEIWLTNWDQFQGYRVENGKLITMINNSPVTLYVQKDGFDNSGNYGTPFFTGQIISDKHYTSFIDIDGDNILEIIDYEGIKSPSNYKIITSIYKLDQVLIYV